MRIKRFIPLLALCMLPVTARAALHIEPADSIIRTGSTITLSGSVGDYIISGSESGVQIVAESGVQRITLSGANMTAPDGLDALTANGPLELTLIGESTITGGSANGTAGKGIVLPQGSLLTIRGEGSLNACGGETWYDSANPSTGTGGTAISGSVAIHDGASVTAKGGKSTGGYNENDTYGGNGVDGDVTVYNGLLEATGGAGLSANSKDYGGHGIQGSVVIHSGKLIVAGGTAEKGRTRNEGGNGVYGNVTVYGGLLDAAGGPTEEWGSTFLITNVGGNGIKGNAAVHGGQLNATGGLASGGGNSNRLQNINRGGHGVDGSAAIYGGRLTAQGGSASEGTSENIGGNGINGAFTAAGGYALATGGDTPDTGSHSSASIGTAALSTATSPVIIGSDQSLLTASMGTGTSPNEPLNGGSFYTAPKDVTDTVSGKRSLETKEVFAVTYACAYDGCTDTHTHYAEGYATYTAATIDELGFSPHFVFAGFVDDQGKAVDSLFLCGPIRLKAT